MADENQAANPEENAAQPDSEPVQAAAAPEQPVAPDSPNPGSNEISKDARMWAMFCHLSGLAGFVIPVVLSGIIAPLIIWQLKKEEDPFVDENGKEALNFQISIGMYALVSGLLICAAGLGFLLLPVVYIINLIFLIIAAVKANNGEHYRYPLTFRFIK